MSHISQLNGKGKMIYNSRSGNENLGMGAWEREPGNGSLGTGTWEWEPGNGSLGMGGLGMGVWEWGAWEWEPGNGGAGNGNGSLGMRLRLCTSKLTRQGCTQGQFCKVTRGVPILISQTATEVARAFKNCIISVTWWCHGNVM